MTENIELIIFELVKNHKNLKKQIDSLQKVLAKCRKSIISKMEESGIFELDSNGDYAKYTIPQTFDESKFAKENPETYKFYSHTETIQNIVFDKKKFKKEMTELYESYQKDMSGRLTIK